MLQSSAIENVVLSLLSSSFCRERSRMQSAKIVLLNYLLYQNQRLTKVSEHLRVIKNRHSACSILLLLFSSFSSFLSLFGAEKKICARTCSRIIIILLISDIGLKYTQNISYPHRRSVNYPIDNYPEAREIHLDFVQIILRDRWIVRM